MGGRAGGCPRDEQSAMVSHVGQVTRVIRVIRVP